MAYVVALKSALRAQGEAIPACRAEWNSHLPLAAGDAESDAPQDTDGPPGYQSTLLNCLSLSTFHSLVYKKFLVSFPVFKRLDNLLDKTGCTRRNTNLSLTLGLSIPQ